MKWQSMGGIAALICAATYLFGFALLVTLLADSGYGTRAINGPDVVRFIAENQGLMILWNTVIYVVNALSLVVLIIALASRLKSTSPDWGNLVWAFGLIWATLVLGSGMIANVTIERVAILAAVDFEAAVRTWDILHSVELGLGGGNEIAGGTWILCVSLAGLLRQTLGKGVIGLGLLTGLSGLLTILPPLGDVAGAIFGLGAIAWFIAIGSVMLFARDALATRSPA